jgi:hypothetical protein
MDGQQFQSRGPEYSRIGRAGQPPFAGQLAEPRTWRTTSARAPTTRWPRTGSGGTPARAGRCRAALIDKARVDRVPDLAGVVAGEENAGDMRLEHGHALASRAENGEVPERGTKRRLVVVLSARARRHGRSLSMMSPQSVAGGPSSMAESSRDANFRSCSEIRPGTCVPASRAAAAFQHTRGAHARVNARQAQDTATAAGCGSRNSSNSTCL